MLLGVSGKRIATMMVAIWQSEEESIIDILRFYEQPIKRGLKMQNLLPVHGVRGQVREDASIFPTLNHMVVAVILN